MLILLWLIFIYWKPTFLFTSMNKIIVLLLRSDITSSYMLERFLEYFIKWQNYKPIVTTTVM